MNSKDRHVILESALFELEDATENVDRLWQKMWYEKIEHGEPVSDEDIKKITKVLTAIEGALK